MIPQSMSSAPIEDGDRFSDKIMRRPRMIPKSGDRFSDQIMRKRRVDA